MHRSTWDVAVTEEVPYTVTPTAGDLHGHGHDPASDPEARLACHIRGTAVELLLAAEGDTAWTGRCDSSVSPAAPPPSHPEPPRKHQEASRTAVSNAGAGRLGGYDALHRYPEPVP